MTKIEVIAEALLKEVYLYRGNIEAAVALLTKYLSAADRDNFREVEADSRYQEQMILKDEVYIELDAARGDPISLNVDQTILHGVDSKIGRLPDPQLSAR